MTIIIVYCQFRLRYDTSDEVYTNLALKKVNHVVDVWLKFRITWITVVIEGIVELTA